MRGSGLLRPADSDAIQASSLIAYPQKSLGARIENRLRDEAGIVQFRRSDGRSAHPTSQGVTLRGLGGNASSRALVTIDGVPQADPFGAWVAWSAYDAIRLGGIVVARGRRANLPWVASLVSSSGMALGEPALRDTVEARFAVRAAVASAAVKVRPDHERILALR